MRKSILTAITTIIFSFMTVLAFANPFLAKYYWETATVESVQNHIKDGVNVNGRGEDEKTPLMLAAMSNKNPDIIRILIENGADVNAQMEGGYTPLILAALNNQGFEIIKVLIKNGADVNAKNVHGETPLISANKFSGDINPDITDIIILLIKHGADVKVKDNEGNTALDYLPLDLRWDSEISWLLRADAFLHSQYWKVATFESVNSNITNGMDVNSRDKYGNTPLILAAFYNENSDIINLLIENGANVSAQNENGTTPLMNADHNKNPDIARILIKRGAKKNFQNTFSEDVDSSLYDKIGKREIWDCKNGYLSSHLKLYYISEIKVFTESFEDALRFAKGQSHIFVSENEITQTFSYIRFLELNKNVAEFIFREGRVIGDTLYRKSYSCKIDF